MKPWIQIVVVFFIGLLLGIAGTGFYIHHCFSRAWINSGDHKHVVDLLDSQLNLDKDQKDKVEKIFDDSKPSMEALRMETNKKLNTIRNNTATQIRALLNADQQKKFDTLKAKWDSKLNTNDKGWHIPGLPPGPPPGGPCAVSCTHSPEPETTPAR